MKLDKEYKGKFISDNLYAYNSNKSNLISNLKKEGFEVIFLYETFCLGLYRYGFTIKRINEELVFDVDYYCEIFEENNHYFRIKDRVFKRHYHQGYNGIIEKINRVYNKVLEKLENKE